jgi:hypothetical protein
VLQAGHQLVVLEVESSSQCESGLGPEAELHWEEDKKAALSRCANLKHSFARTARDCPDVLFLTLEACMLPSSGVPSLPLQPSKNYLSCVRDSFVRIICARVYYCSGLKSLRFCLCSVRN